MINNNEKDIDEMLNYIESAILYSHGGPYCDLEYKKECLGFIENLIDAVLP